MSTVRSNSWNLVISGHFEEGLLLSWELMNWYQLVFLHQHSPGHFSSITHRIRKPIPFPNSYCPTVSSFLTLWASCCMLSQRGRLQALGWLGCWQTLRRLSDLIAAEALISWAEHWLLKGRNHNTEEQREREKMWIRGFNHSILKEHHGVKTPAQHFFILHVQLCKCGTALQFQFQSIKTECNICKRYVYLS